MLLSPLRTAYGSHRISDTLLQHSLMTHYLLLYFPEIERYFDGAHADWFTRFMLKFPATASIRQFTWDTFRKETWKLVGREVNKQAWLAELYQCAFGSIGLPVAKDSIEVQSFRLQLHRYQQLVEQRDSLAEQAHHVLTGRPDYGDLRSPPGIGPMLSARHKTA